MVAEPRRHTRTATISVDEGVVVSDMPDPVHVVDAQVGAACAWNVAEAGLVPVPSLADLLSNVPGGNPAIGICA